MQSITGGRPNEDEYAPFFGGYVARVPDGDIIEILQAQLDTTHALLASISPEQAQARPKPDDWNIHEVLGHLTDGEQHFAYRALRLARGDSTPLPGFEQDDYVAAARSAERS